MNDPSYTHLPLAREQIFIAPITAPHSPSHPNLSQPLPSRPSIREHGLCGRVSGFEAWTHVHKGRGGREIIASQYTDSDTGICSNLCWGISPNDDLCWLSCLQISGWTNYRSTWAGHCFVSFITKSERHSVKCERHSVKCERHSVLLPRVKDTPDTQFQISRVCAYSWLPSVSVN